MDRLADLNRNRRKEPSIVLVLIAVVFVSLLIISYKDRDWPDWTGFGSYTEKVDNDQGRVTVLRQPRKTLWDMLGLLIVPAMLAGGAYWLDQSGKLRERQSQDHQAQEITVQNYLDKITDLLLEEGLLSTQSSSAERIVARSRTLTALRTLDGVRKAIIIRFLYESGLITGDSPVTDLSEANLKHSIFNRADLHGVNLHRVKLEQAELSEANLSNAILCGADLREAKLTNAVLHGAKLRGAVLAKAMISDAKFNTRPLTSEEFAALPPGHQTLNTVKGAIKLVQELGTAVEHTGKELLKIERERKESQIALLQEQLDYARQRTKVWHLEGRDIVADEILSGSKLNEQIEQLNRQRSDRYGELQQQEIELEDQLRQARRKLEQDVHADLEGANLEGADLRWADLRWANLRKVKLVNANLQGAILSNADLSNADLKNANFANAVLAGTKVSNDQLAKAKSLKGAWWNGKRMP